MIRITKQLLLNPASIWISGIKCTVSNIIRLVDVLNCKRIMMTIDSLSNDCLFLTYIKSLKLEIFVKQRAANQCEVSVVMPDSLFESVLENAISEDPENIFIIELLDWRNESIYLHHSYEQLITTGATNVFLSISFDENAILVSVNKASIQPQKLYRRIKALQFD